MNFVLSVSPSKEMEDHTRQRGKGSTLARVEPIAIDCTFNIHIRAVATIITHGRGFDSFPPRS